MPNPQPSSGRPFLLLLSGVYAGLLAVVALQFLNLSVPAWEPLAAALACSVVLALLTMKRPVFFTALVLGGSAAVGGTVYSAMNGPRGGYFAWLFSYLSGVASAEPGYRLPTVLLTALLLSLLTFLLCYRFCGYLPAAVVGFLLLAAAALQDFSLPDWFCCLAVGFGLLYLILAARRHTFGGALLFWGGRPGRKDAAFAWMAVPFVLVCVLLASHGPRSSDPVEISKLDALYNKLYQDLTVVNVDSTHLFSAGYQITGNDLDGPCFPNDIHVLDVKMGVPLYLKCSSSDLYTGNSWTDTLRGADSIYGSAASALDELSTGSRWLPDGQSMLRHALFTEPAEITFCSLKANYLFLPPLFNSLDTSPAQASTLQDGETVLNKKMSRSYRYTLTAFGLDLKSAAFRRAARQSRAGLYAQPVSGVSEAERQTLQKRAAFFRAHNLQLPSTLPARVRQLAARITAGRTSDYDKAAAIEQFLATTETYTLTPPKRPTGWDVVDYFLFQSHRGYCSSYATAMVVLARSVGLPARYCQGYVMPETSGENGVYAVTDRQAHAWVEVYLEGIGWVTFEPTSPYRSDFYNLPTGQGGRTQAPAETESVASAAVSSAPSSSTPSSARPASLPSAPSAPQAPQRGTFPKRAIPVLLAALLLGLLLAGCRGFRLSEARRIAAAAPREWVILQFRRLLRLLRLCGLRPAPNATMREFAGTVAQSAPELAGPPLLAAVSAFEAARYGSMVPSGRALAALADYDARLSAALPARLGRVRYCALHTLLGLI